MQHRGVAPVRSEGNGRRKAVQLPHSPVYFWESLARRQNSAGWLDLLLREQGCEKQGQHRNCEQRCTSHKSLQSDSETKPSYCAKNVAGKRKSRSEFSDRQTVRTRVHSMRFAGCTLRRLFLSIPLLGSIVAHIGY